MKTKTRSPEEKDQLLLDGIHAVFLGQQTQGELLRELRKNLLGLTQQNYADLVGISRRTLSDIENGKTQASISTLNQIFKPLGLKLGLIPRSPNLIEKAFNKNP